MNVDKFNVCIAKIMKRKENIKIIVSSEEGRLRTTKPIVAIQIIKWHYVQLHANKFKSAMKWNSYLLETDFVKQKWRSR